MKKIIIAVIALLSFGVAEAQFSVQQRQSMPEVVWRAGAGNITLYRKDVGDGEYRYLVAVKTTNQFDDLLLLHLGKKGKALATTTQLLDDLFVPGEVYDLIDDNGEPFTAKCSNIFNEYVIFKKGYAGQGHILLGQIRRLQDALANE